MIKVGILSLSMVLGDEEAGTPRHVDDEIAFEHKSSAPSCVVCGLLLPLLYVGLL
jgi:hypothetical protein